MDHGVQIESLRSYAKENNAIPFYLLYNCTSLPSRSGFSLGTTEEWFGCTLIAAEYLFNNYHNTRRSKSGALTWQIPNFYDLHPVHAFCFHEIVCPSDPEALLRKVNTKLAQDEALLPQALRGLSDLGIIENAPGFFKINTFKKDGNWKTVKDLRVNETWGQEKSSILRDPEYLEKPKQLKGPEMESANPEFSPKTRLIVTQ